MKFGGLPLLCSILWATHAHAFSLLASPLGLGLTSKPVASSVSRSASSSASVVPHTTWKNARSSIPPLHLADASLSLTDVPPPLESTAVPDVATVATTAMVSEPVASTAISPAISLDPSPTMATTISSATSAVASATHDLDPNNLGLVAASLVFICQAIHSALNYLGMQHNTWGTSIVLLTLSIKLITSPLMQFQISSNQRMRALQPQVDRFKEMYKDNPQMVGKLTNQLYSKNSVYPMAMAVPSLIQIPILLGLYRAVSTLSSQSALDEPFLFLPSLVGPPNDFLQQPWHDGAPSMGWHDYLSYLVLPLLVSTVQFTSQNLMTASMGTGTQDGQQGVSPVPKGFMQYISPLMMSYMSLRFPPALSVYWVSNSVISAGLNYIMSNHQDIRVVDLDGNESVTPVSQLPNLNLSVQAPKAAKPFMVANKKPKKKKKRPALQEG